MVNHWVDKKEIIEMPIDDTWPEIKGELYITRQYLIKQAYEYDGKIRDVLVVEFSSGISFETFMLTDKISFIKRQNIEDYPMTRQTDMLHLVVENICRTYFEPSEYILTEVPCDMTHAAREEVQEMFDFMKEEPETEVSVTKVWGY